MHVGRWYTCQVRPVVSLAQESGGGFSRIVNKSVGLSEEMEDVRSDLSSKKIIRAFDPLNGMMDFSEQAQNRSSEGKRKVIGS